MQKWLVLLGLCALSAAAPQNWPYRDSLMPYRYGYPSQSQYKFLPQVEDDEETGPYLSGLHGRQDLVIGSEGGDRARPTEEPNHSIQTGSAAPIVEPTKAPPASPTHKPVGVDTGRPVQPAPFPAARPPPTQPPTGKPEEEEDDESEEDADADADDDVEAEDDAEDEADDGNSDNAADEEEESPDAEDDEEEERRRQEPLVILKEDKVPPTVVPVVPTVPAVPTIAPVKPVVNTTVVNGTSGTGVTETDVVEDSSEEVGVPPGVEALVPGYVTDQGEVLVPVDTVTGDQPISIVPDPYGQPARGVPLTRGPQYRGPYEESDDYESPYFYTDGYGGLRRQEDSDEVDTEVEVKGSGKVPSAVSGSSNRDKDNVVEVVDEVETDDEDATSGEASSTKDSEPDSKEAELEGRNEYLTAFPPSRSPEFFAYIKSRIPVDSSSEYDDYSSGEYNSPYGDEPRPVPQPVYVRRRFQQQNSPSVSLAVSLSGNQQGYGSTPGYYNRRVQPQPFYGGYPFSGPQGYYDDYQSYRPMPSQFFRRPVAVYRPNQFNGYPQPSVVAFRPNQFGGYPQAGGYVRPNYNRPVPFRPNVNVGVRRPVQTGVKQSQHNVGYLRPTAVKITPLRRPTPVIKQKKQPVPTQQDSYEIYPFADTSIDHDTSSGAMDSFEMIPNLPKDGQDGKTSIVKTRRNAKMAKKPNKKLIETKKASSADPLNILKKINPTAKRS